MDISIIEVMDKNLAAYIIAKGVKLQGQRRDNQTGWVYFRFEELSAAPLIDEWKGSDPKVNTREFIRAQGKVNDVVRTARSA